MRYISNLPYLTDMDFQFQRRKYARRIIHDDEQAELDELGFIWKLHSGVRKTFVVDKKKLKKKEIGQSQNENSSMRNDEESQSDNRSCKRDDASQNENCSSSSFDERSQRDHPCDTMGMDPQFADPSKKDEDSQDPSSRNDGLAGLMELARIAAATKMQEDALVNGTTPLPHAERSEEVVEGVATGRPEKEETRLEKEGKSTAPTWADFVQSVIDGGGKEGDVGGKIGRFGLDDRGNMAEVATTTGATE